MNDEIKVNDYIRTNDGIKQIIKINTGADKTYSGEFILDRKYKNSKSISRKNIIKSNPNILKVLENGDLVNNKYIVVDIHSYGFYYLEDGGISQNQIDVGDIETIVTKEQFEKRMYRVEE